jgi:hypothetical protein
VAGNPLQKGRVKKEKLIEERFRLGGPGLARKRRKFEEKDLDHPENDDRDT